ncbi:MAG: hypothetical protein HQ561_03300 [Desulfobacteraceae bacterium]|nr:hypothetical protein [Desulfobacteraceae bacterium]
MKQVKKDLQAVSNILKQLTKKTEKIANKLAKLEKAKAAKKPKTKVTRKVKAKTARTVKAKTTRKVRAKTARTVKAKATRKVRAKVATKARPKARAKARAKSPKVSASGTVLGIIKRSRKGVDVITLRKESDLEGRKINDIVHRLKKEGKIKAISRGVYVKA